MNNKILTYSLIICCTVLILGNRTTEANQKMDIATIAERVQNQEGMSIDNWSVFAREINNEIQTKEEYEKEIRILKEKYPQFEWNMIEDNGVWKAEATFQHEKKNVIETIRMVSTKEHKDIVTYIIYEANGQKWNRDISSFLLKTFQDREKDIFHHVPSVFSCIKGSINGNMNSVLTTEMKKYLDLFKAEKIESVHEDKFYSVSVHSPYFTQSLTNKEINMQVGLRKSGLGQDTSFVIGTPIITFEY